MNASQSSFNKGMDRSESGKLGNQLPDLNAQASLELRNTKGDNLFNPPNPNATITNFNSGVNIQASMDDQQTVELAPQLQGKKKKKVKKVKKKENYLNFDADSVQYNSIESNKVQSMNPLDDSNNPQELGNGQVYDSNAQNRENQIGGDGVSSIAHVSVPLGENLIIEQDDGEKADGEDDDDFDYEDAKISENRQNFALDDDDDDGFF